MHMYGSLFGPVRRKYFALLKKKNLRCWKKKNLRWIITDCMQHRTCLKHWYITVSPRGHLFYVDFLFFIFTSHRGGNVATAVRTFPPRWEHSHCGGNTSHRGGNVSTAVRTFPPRWEHSHRGENIPTAVGILLTEVETFLPRWEHSHRGENTPTAVRIFPPRWEHSHRSENIPTAVRSISTAVGSHVICDDTFARHHLVPTCDTIHPIIETAWNTVKYTRLEYGSLPSSTIKYGSLQPSTIAYGPPTIKYTRVWQPPSSTLEYGPHQ